MMLAVQTFRATTRAPADSAWASYNLNAMARPIHSVSNFMMDSKKRKRDSFEAYDFQVHRHQKMRYSLLREQPQDYHQPCSVYPCNNPNVMVPKVYPSPPPSPVTVTEHPGASRSLKSDMIRKTRRRSRKSSKKSSTRRTVRMTKRHYNKKKRLEMREATGRQIKNILGSSSTSSIPSQKLYHVRQKAEQLDIALRDQCNTIVRKEQDIKSWLGMTTSNKSKIVSLRNRLHVRWAEVKDLQSAVKPKRQRLKNLKFAVLCEERSIAEE